MTTPPPSAALRLARPPAVPGQRPFARCGASLANLTAFLPAVVGGSGPRRRGGGGRTAPRPRHGRAHVGGVLAECVAAAADGPLRRPRRPRRGLLLVGGAALLLVPAVDVASRCWSAGCAAWGSGSPSSSRARCRAGTCPPTRAARASRWRGRGVRARRRRAARGRAGCRRLGADAVFVVGGRRRAGGRRLAPLAARASGVGRGGRVRGRTSLDGRGRASRRSRSGHGRPESAGSNAGVERAQGRAWLAVARIPVQRRPAVLSPPPPWRRDRRRVPPLAASGPAVASALFVQALAATAGRYGAGRWGDRHGHARLVAPGLVALGVGTLLLLGVGRPALLLAAWRCSGPASGCMQSATYAVDGRAVPVRRATAPRARCGTSPTTSATAWAAGVRRPRRRERLPRRVALTGLVVLAGLRAARRIGWRDRLRRGAGSSSPAGAARAGGAPSALHGQAQRPSARPAPASPASLRTRARPPALRH
jgi:hypothetical protein